MGMKLSTHKKIRQLSKYAIYKVERIYSAAANTQRNKQFESVHLNAKKICWQRKRKKNTNQRKTFKCTKYELCDFMTKEMKRILIECTTNKKLST